MRRLILWLALPRARVNRREAISGRGPGVLPVGGEGMRHRIYRTGGLSWPLEG